MTARPLVHPKLATSALSDRFTVLVAIQERIDTYDGSGSPVTVWTPYATLDNVPVQLYYPASQSTMVQENIGVVRRFDRPEVRMTYTPEIKQGDRLYVHATGDTWLIEAVRHDSLKVVTALTLEDVDIAAETN